MENSQNYQHTENSVSYTEKFPKLNTITYNLDKFLYDLNENFKKHKYRKCLRDIKEKENLNYDREDLWKLNKIKLKCLLQIINKKFTKYSENPVNFKRVETWLYRVNIEIEKWVEYLNKLELIEEPHYKLTVEFITKSVIEQIYNCQLYFKKDKKISDSIAVLAIAERLIKPAVHFTDDPDLIYLSSKIFLAISTLHISNNNFEISKIYASNSLRLCDLELKLRFNSEEEGIDVKKLSEAELDLLQNVGVNFAFSFYHLGVCEENLGNIVKAIESYKQSKWFANNFLSDSLYDLIQFFTNVEKRAVEYDKFLRDIKLTHPLQKRCHSSEKTKKINMKFCKDDSQKYQETLRFLDKLEMHEFDQDNSQEKKSEYAKKLLSTVFLINNLMSDRFRDITQIIPKYISNLSKETQEKIQKRLNEIKSEKIYFEAENFRKKTMESNNNKNRTSIIDTAECNLNTNNLLSDSNFMNYNTTNTEPNHAKSKNIISKFNSDYRNNKKPNRDVIDEKYRVNIINTNDKDKYKKEEAWTKNSIVNSNKDKNNFLSARAKIFYNNKNDISLSPSRDNDLKNSKVQIKTSRPSSHHPNREPVKKFAYSKIIFEKNFQNTMNYLDKYIDREFSFQKKILKLKNSENVKTDVNYYEPRESKYKFQTFYQNILKNSETKVMKEDSTVIKKKSLINQEDPDMEKKKDQLLVRTLKSLNPKAFDEYVEFNKKNKVIQFVSKKDTIKMIDIKNFSQRNNDTDKKILKELEYLDKYENYIKKNNGKKNEYLKTNTKYEMKEIDDHFVSKK